MTRVEQRTRRYWFEDGLVEITSGGLMVLAGLLCVLEPVVRPRVTPSFLWNLVFPVVVMGGVGTSGLVVRRLKERITYPRTGYVRYPPTPPARRGIAWLVGGLTGAVLVGAFRTWPGLGSRSDLLLGVGIGAELVYLGIEFGLRRFHVLAAVSALAGTAGSWTRLDRAAGTAVYLLVVGAALVISGAATLWSYLRRSGGTEGERT